MPPGTKIFDFGWAAGHLGQVGERIVQHLQLTVIPLLLGIVIALVLAVIAPPDWMSSWPIQPSGRFCSSTTSTYRCGSAAAFARASSAESPG